MLYWLLTQVLTIILDFNDTLGIANSDRELDIVPLRQEYLSGAPSSSVLMDAWVPLSGWETNVPRART